MDLVSEMQTEIKTLSGNTLHIYLHKLLHLLEHVQKRSREHVKARGNIEAKLDEHVRVPFINK